MSKRTILSFFPPSSSSKKQRLARNEELGGDGGEKLPEVSNAETTLKEKDIVPEENEMVDQTIPEVKLSDNVLDFLSEEVNVEISERGNERESVWYTEADIGTWRETIGPEYDKEYFKTLMRFVGDEMSKHTIYPKRDAIFSALQFCDFNKLKVVILGQDPYHGPNQAHGLAFSVLQGNPLPPSLRNIFKEAQSDVAILPPKHGNLSCWSSQGVLLLNTCLTVRRGQPNSHQNKGWETFTDAIIREINEKKDGVVFILWGKPAEKKCSTIDPAKHCIIKSSHPSPLGATKTSHPFIGSRCFSRCNDQLQRIGKDPINWNVF